MRAKDLLSIVILFIYLAISGCVLPKEKEIELGRHICWNWTPDGRIIYVMENYSVTKTRLAFYRQGPERQTLICTIDKDGKNWQVIKRIIYYSKQAKLEILRDKYEQEEIERYKREGIPLYLPATWTSAANPFSGEIEFEKSEGTGTGRKVWFAPEWIAVAKADSAVASGKFPDPPLADISHIDWNAKNNLLVVEANFIVDNKEPYILGHQQVYGVGIITPQGEVVKYLGEGCYPAWSPDGKMIAFSTKDNQLWIMNADGSERRRIDKDNDKVWAQLPAWSPDGTKLAVGGRIVDLNGKILVDLPRRTSTPNFSPDGRWIADYLIMVRADGSGRNAGPYGHRPKFSPDGKYIIGGWEGGIGIVNVNLEDGKMWDCRYVTPPGKTPGHRIVEEFKKGR